MSPPLNVRVSDAWVESDATGAVRLAGTTIPFGPSGGGGPAQEVLAWADVPAFTNLEDGGQNYNMGIRFQVTETLPCIGIQWSRVPDAVLAPSGGTHQASLWDEGPTKLGSENFVPVAGTVQDILFTGGPVTLVPATNYIAAIYTRSYVFRASGGVYPSSPSGKVVADVGRLTPFNGGPDLIGAAPTGTSAGLFYISPIVEV